MVGAVSAATLGLGLLGLSATPALADHVVCGYEVVADLTLSTDLGPCPGDGLLVRTSGVTINLNGHTITGSNGTNTTNQEQAGIHIIQADNVTVNGRGTIQNFDAGVVIEESSNNLVHKVSAVDNINHSALTGALNPCEFGDGIVLFDSSNNEIRANLLENNGPYDGAAIVGDSDNNLVRDNHAVNNRSLNRLPDGTNGPCGPFGGGGADTPGVGRVDQNIGIRVEGPGSDDNLIRRNLVDNNLLDGISVNGHVANPPGGAFPPQDPNTGTQIIGNVVTNNGFTNLLNRNGDPIIQDGIAVLRQGPFGTIVGAAQDTTIVGNIVRGNARNGIFMPALTSENTISRNLVEDNGTDGILVQGPFTVCVERDADRNCLREEPRPGSTNNTLFDNRGSGNGEHDGHDDNLNCDMNRWRGNLFETVNQPCVATGGTGSVPPAAAAAVASTDDDGSADRGMTGHPSRS
jgi:parallel beta-helix repeat protein